MKQSKGFTLVELVVVVALICIIVALGFPQFYYWRSDYQFSAATNNFINAAQLTRVKAIGGQVTMNITSLSGSGQTLTVTVADGSSLATAFYFTSLFPLDSTVPLRSASVADIPLRVNDFVTLVGINDPDFLNGNVFRVKTLTASTPTLETGKLKYTYRVTTLIFTCESCPESGTGSCLQWTTPTGYEQPTTGKVQVASCVRFLTTDQKKANQPDWSYKAYAVERYGNSMECIYDPRQIDFMLWVLKPTAPDAFTGAASMTTYWDQVAGTNILSADWHPIVFDSSGGTRNQDTYKVELKKITEGKVNPAPAAFVVLPTGRISLDTARGN